MVFAVTAAADRAGEAESRDTRVQRRRLGVSNAGGKKSGTGLKRDEKREQILINARNRNVG